MGTATALSLWGLAMVQLDHEPRPASYLVAELPDSPAPSQSVTTTAVPVSEEIPSPVLETTMAEEPLPAVTTWTVTEQVRPGGMVWTVELAKRAGREIFGDVVFDRCVDPHVQAESGWDWLIFNTQGSGAYGLGQALPGSKMSSAGDDWETNPRTQLLWLHDFVEAEYGGACAAWAHFRAHGWY